MSQTPTSPEKNQDFIVIPYTGINSLYTFLAHFSESDLEVLKQKHHYTYFDEYLKHEKLKTIVVESAYIDKDYLDDFANYYIRSFYEYRKLCARLHFFTQNFTDKEFIKLLDSGENVELLTNSYIGSMIVKPIPNTCIGKTTLKHYDTNDDGRVFPITRFYTASLFGIELKVKTLAFQEQDNSVAACATSALWSAFQGTGMLFHHTIPSPVHITESATKNYPALERNFPNSGLNGKMMAQAVREVGLEPYNEDVSDYHSLKATLYAFLNAKIPAILGLKLYETDDVPIPPVGAPLQEVRFKGYHAVAVCGYDLGSHENLNYYEGKDSVPFFLKSSRINQIFVHDDQMGPFSRMELNDSRGIYDLPEIVATATDDKYSDVKEKQSKPAKSNQTINTTWKSKNGALTRTVAKEDIILIPIHNKIRVPFKDIFQIMKELNSAIFFRFLLAEDTSIVWDIKLNFIQDMKRDLINQQKNPVNKSKIKRLHKILTKSYPKYVWRCILEYKGRAVMEIWFDATDISNGNNYYLCTIPVLEQWVKEIFVQIIVPRIALESVTDFRTRAILARIINDCQSI